ncbi:HNH endonuclease family protein [Corynebacterium sp. H78]|uniref:HNH endonuclease family protein n=1 Tax=Corynebacterium sp. H78 TaxID=3133417 RepID=UPI0030A15AA9
MRWWRELPRRDVVTLLESVRVQPQRVTITGYERELFGGWSVDGACDTRQRVLVRWFGGSGCKLDEDAAIADPYTGKDVLSAQVDVDHVYPLAAAWDFGAAQWDSSRRREFANDLDANLVPTMSAINREKSDLTPSEWMPTQRELRCDYAARFVAVAVKWDLAVSVDDWSVMAKSCGIRAVR